MTFPCIYVIYSKLVHPFHFSPLYLTHMLILYLFISFGAVPVKIFCPYLKSGHLSYGILRVFHIFYISDYQKCFLNIFSHFVVCLFFFHLMVWYFNITVATSSLLIHRNILDFCMLILNAEILLNLLTVSKTANHLIYKWEKFYFFLSDLYDLSFSSFIYSPDY
jgi:hypothetical protein